jgi:hypothetical protein
LVFAEIVNEVPVFDLNQGRIVVVVVKQIEANRSKPPFASLLRCGVIVSDQTFANEPVGHHPARVQNHLHEGAERRIGQSSDLRVLSEIEG